tara:strand:+ start:3915 stop:4904 length:990 start_codon:yes stop_codon:yes gene_type:complete
LVYSIKNKDLINLYKSSLRIRLVEETIAEKYIEKKMRCPTHLSIGQEAISAAYGFNILESDFAISTHRAHAHYLAKGGSLKAMIAEIYGKSSGCAKGKGGSMHLIDRSINFMGSSAIVGNSIPVGVGIGLAIKLKKTKQISTVFLGDGSTEEGVFFESINFASLKELPVLFVCENNLYSVYSPMSVRQPKNRDNCKIVENMGVKSKKINGYDIVESSKAFKLALGEIRKNSKPQYLEFSTYRWREHCGPNFDNDIGYRTKDEYNLWKKNDPIKHLYKKIISNDKVLKKELDEIKNDINEEIKKAFLSAENDSPPKLEEAYQGIYADEIL